MQKKLILLTGFLAFCLTREAMAMELMSKDFQPAGSLPLEFTCDGKNLSPSLYWKDAPQNTQSFVLILEDPDAPSGTWTHWVLFNIPATTDSIAKNATTFPQGTLVGKNSWGHNNYDGPCPPQGEHRYFFKLYAVDTQLPTHPGLTKAEVETAIHGHILASTELVAKYQRTK